jgi:hypothetical protein
VRSSLPPAFLVRLPTWLPACLLACFFTGLLALVCLIPQTGLAEPLAARHAAPDEQVTPDDESWPLGARQEEHAAVAIFLDEDAPGFRVELAPRPGGEVSSVTSALFLRACAGLKSTLRRDLHKTRAVTFKIRASRPVAGLMTITSSNTEEPGRLDRFFGSFVIGTGWKTLRLPYGDLAPLPGWPEEAERLGFAPGDRVLRPDSVEDLCIGAEAGRLPREGVTLFIRDLRFTP